MNYIIHYLQLYPDVLTVSINYLDIRNCFKNGKIFLVDIFNGNQELANSVTNSLLMGFI